MQIEIRNQSPRRNRLGELITAWLVNSVALMVVSKVIRGIEFTGAEGWQGLTTVLAAGAVLGLIHVAVKPLLLVLTLPINVLSLGLFTLVINAACLGLVAWIVKDFVVAGFWPALWGALLLSVVSMILHAFVGGMNVRVAR